MTITAGQVKTLREKTGAGMMECKNALTEANGDLEAATTLLRKRGLAQAAKRAGRSTSEGMIGHYIHMGGKVGVIVEINCESDFVARTEDFQSLVRDLALHIAASAPLAVSAEEIPAELVERERAVYLEQVKGEGKPENLWDRIVEGKLRRFYEESALLEQPFVKDPDKSVGDLVTEASAKTGEAIRVRRFARFALGD